MPAKIRNLEKNDYICQILFDDADIYKLSNS